jgi:transketolase
VILIGTGSEVAPCLEAQDMLKADGIAARVVSLASWELFDEQDAGYRESVLPGRIAARVSLEAASILGWERYVGPDGESIGMRHFGASAPWKVLMKEFGFTAENIAAAAKRQIAQRVRS